MTCASRCCVRVVGRPCVVCHNNKEPHIHNVPGDCCGCEAGPGSLAACGTPLWTTKGCEMDFQLL